MEQTLGAIRELAELAHSGALAVADAVGKAIVGEQVNECIFVPMFLASNLIRQQEAVRVLVDHNLPVEAAVVALSQFEARLDLLYLFDDVTRATAWMNHTDEKNAPWRVAEKIKKVFGYGTPEADREHRLFRELSKIKHSNPVAGSLLFGVRGDGDHFTVTTTSPEDALSALQGGVALALSTRMLCEGVGRFGELVCTYFPFDTAPMRELVRIDQTAVTLMRQLIEAREKETK